MMTLMVMMISLMIHETDDEKLILYSGGCEHVEAASAIGRVEINL